MRPDALLALHGRGLHHPAGGDADVDPHVRHDNAAALVAVDAMRENIVKSIAAETDRQVDCETAASVCVCRSPAAMETLGVCGVIKSCRLGGWMVFTVTLMLS